MRAPQIPIWRMSERGQKHPGVGWASVLDNCLRCAGNAFRYVGQSDKWDADLDARQVSLDEVHRRMIEQVWQVPKGEVYCVRSVPVSLGE